MKNFTFLVSFLLFVSLATGQSIQNLEGKAQKLRESHARYSEMKALAKRHPVSGLFKTDAGLKNAVAMQKLDSIIYQDYDSEAEAWINYYKDIFLYNEELKNTEYIEQEMNETSGIWEDYSRAIYHYNENGLVNEVLMHGIDDDTGEMTLQDRILAYYDNEGRPDSTVYYSTEDQSTWIREMKEEVTYNEAGQLIQTDWISWEEDEGTIKISILRFTYTYNTQGQLSASALIMIVENVEFPLTEIEYFYDSSGNRTASEYSSLNWETFELEKTFRYEFEYNTSGNVSVQTNFSWNKEQEDWDATTKTEYEYNSINDVSVETTYNWDEGQEDWVAAWKDETVYSELNLSEVVIPYIYQYMNVDDEFVTLHKAISEEISYQMQNNEWSYNYKNIYYYSKGGSTSAEKVLKTQVSVYPNPFTNKITFTWSGLHQLSLEVYTITGTKVIERLITSGVEVPVSGLNNGIYLFRLMNENQTIHSGKLVKN